MTPPRQVARRPLVPASRRGWRKVRAPREYGAGQWPARATSGKVPQRADRPHATGFALGPVGKGERVRQERTASPATGAAWQTPLGARPNRGGRRRSFENVTQGHSRPTTRVGRVRRAVRHAPEEWSSHPRLAEGGQNPAYRPPGAFFPQPCPQTCRGIFEPFKEQLGNVDWIPLTIHRFLNTPRVFKLNL
jgi:hypothetical protein